MGTKRESVSAERGIIVERFEASGLSMAEFCRREGIAYSQFMSRRKRLSSPGESVGGFAELVLAPGGGSPAEAALVDRHIRVNGVAPGPIWTPFIPAMGRAPDDVAAHGDSSPMKRAGQPTECASAFVFLASLDSTSMTGQGLHPNGGAIVNG